MSGCRDEGRERMRGKRNEGEKETEKGRACQGVKMKDGRGCGDREIRERGRGRERGSM